MASMITQSKSALLVVCQAGALLAAKVDLNKPTGKTGVMMVDKLGAHVRFFEPATWKETANIEMGMNADDFVVTAESDSTFGYQLAGHLGTGEESRSNPEIGGN